MGGWGKKERRRRRPGEGRIPGQPPGFWMGTTRLSEASHGLPGSVFQLTHDMYKPFIFAADTLEDLSM